MKTLTLKLGDKTYSTIKVTAFLSKEALKIQKESLELAKIGKEIQNDLENLDTIEELLDKMAELNDRKAALICEVYGNQFTIDELQKNLSDEEINIEINKIILAVSGVIQKN